MADVLYKGTTFHTFIPLSVTPETKVLLGRIQSPYTHLDKGSNQNYEVNTTV
jgi:hypothetical protein